MSRPPKIYVAATRQNDGKTTTALGLVEVIHELVPKVGYMKPVGQQVSMIGGNTIDKDVKLMSDIFRIGTPLADMSPVTVPKGFTEDFIRDGDSQALRDKICNACRRAEQGKDFMVIEGTGHAGVGSVFDLSNAEVAAMIGAPVIIVTCAGIGRPIDEVMLNKAVFDQQGVELLGVIVNKVMPEKYDKVSEYVRLGFKRKGIEVLGVIPFYPVLANPTLRQLQEDIRGELLNGEENLERVASRVVVGAMPPHSIFDYFKGDVLLVTPGNREDLILSAISCNAPGIAEDYSVQGIILTCGVWPNRTVLKLLKMTDIPIILVEDDTFATAQKINNLIIKIRPEDTEKVATVKRMVREHVDVETIVRRAGEAAARA